MRQHRILPGLLIAIALVGASCSSESRDEPTTADTTTQVAETEPTDPPATDPPATDPPATDPPATDPPSTDPPVTEPPATDPPTTEPAQPVGSDVRTIVETLAADELDGRNNQTDGSTFAQEFLSNEIAMFSSPPSDGGYLLAYDAGTNIVGIVPGGELADEYVLVGAHYDHLGPGECAGDDTADEVCNGATDNATGVAAAMEVVRAIAAQGTPRRSIVLALWDGEEDGLIGSLAYVDNPAVPLEQTVAYVNFDIQGANLLPSLENTTIMVGAETGGPNFVAAAAAALSASSLDTASFSIVFGQGRSDHAALAAAGVPSVFFTDANTGCYHTVKDDISAVDFDKLDQQILAALALTTDLAATDTPPVFDAAAPLSAYPDAVELLRVVRSAEADFALLGAETAAQMTALVVDLQAVVDAGPDLYNGDAIGTVLGVAGTFVTAVADSECATA